MNLQSRKATPLHVALLAIGIAAGVYGNRSTLDSNEGLSDVDARLPLETGSRVATNAVQTVPQQYSQSREHFIERSELGVADRPWERT